MLSRPPAQRHRWEVAERVGHLAAVPIFSRLDPAALRGVAERFHAKRVARGEFVFLQGQPAATLNALSEGRVKVIRETDEGRQVILRLINPGELFGVSGGWGEAVYPASARALDDVVVLQLPAPQFAALLGTYPELAVAVIRELGGRLREAEARILDLQTERVEQRLARALLRLTNPGSAGLRAHDVLEIGLTRQDLADLAGTTLSTASRTLSSWHRQGIVLAGRERVTIRDLSRLARIAEGNDDDP
ncbi:MAG: Crp/Fnr family transcriptional regulator [Chloroflexota bacterium]|nr:Crp/Fnr family transcriptional regulator [Chloroflexota bacterium]